MFKIILAFLFLFGLFFFGIKAVRDMTGKDRWDLTKLVSYSIIIATLVIVVMVSIVILF